MRTIENFRLLGKLFLLVSVLAGCGTNDLPDYFLLDRLRVVSANTTGAAAEFSAGDAGIQVAFHVSDSAGAGRSLTYSIDACVDPGIGIGAKPGCSGNPTRISLISGAIFNNSGNATASYSGVITSPVFSIPAAGIIFIDPKSGSPRAAYAQANGVAYLVVLSISASATESLTAFKRVIVSTRAMKNQNPSFGSPALTFGGGDPATYPLTTAAFTTNSVATAGSAETYTVQDANGGSTALTEKLTVTWLVTAGTIKYTRTDPGVENRYVPADPLPPHTSFIGILRDDRGGETFVQFDK